MSTLEVLNINNLQKYYGPKLVLDDINLVLSRGDRAALVGENGAGKTTLARILIGQEQADLGDVRLTPGVEVGYLPQEVTTETDTTIGVYIQQLAGNLDRLWAEMQRLEHQMAEPLEADALDAVLERYGDVQDEFQRRGGYALEDRTARIFAGLEIEYLDQGRQISSLSGGEKTRVTLAALLLREPDLLILDEPTNHLDFAGLDWLEEYLSAYGNALLLISHDRRFINRIVNQVIEISAHTHTLAVYHGNYEQYLEQREQQMQREIAAFEAQRDEIIRLRRLAKTKAHNPKAAPERPDNDKFLYNAKRANAEQTRSKEIRDARQRLAVLEADRLENPNHVWRIGFEFDPLDLTSPEPVRLRGLCKRYGDQVLLDNVDAVIQKGERIALVAPNGTGKTTLLRIIMGQIDADAGEAHVAPSARLGYLDQEGETLDLDLLVLEAYRQEASGADKELLAQLHRNGLFTGDLLAEKRVGDLSVGQRRKFDLARIIASRANVLLLDEPTNHLDLVSIEALEKGLLAFPGAVLAVSHDRWFIERVATQVWHLKDGHLTIEMRDPQEARA